ncbi:MAG: serine hydrolase [Sedimentisphaerales bacterium]|nr:serine hydrolase [Sedimentisphaerales bacterium]
MTKCRICTCIFLLLVAVGAKEVFADQMVFPGAAWTQVTPESQYVDSAKLKAAVDYLRDHSGSNGVDRLIIVRNGRAIWKGPEANRPQRVWSVTKAFTSTAQGLLIEDGKCSLDTLACQYNPKDLSEYYPNVTLRHFATMTSGYDGVGGSYDFDEKHRGDENTLVGPLPPFFAPGTKYQYWDEATQQYGYVLTQIAGEPLYDYLKRRILVPIGISGTDWELDKTGKVPNWTGGLVISAADLARFGLLFLNEGNWAGKQLVPVSWVREATSVQVPPSIPNGLPSSTRKGSGVYGYHWWPNGVTPEGERRWPDAPLCTYARSGYNNNDLFIIPAWKMVIVRLGLDQQEHNITKAEYNTFIKKVGEAIFDPVVEGHQKVWHPLTVSFRGPTACETDGSPNPFLDYRLAVTFTGPAGKTYNVPGFFAGDGHGDGTGNVWRVHFTPDAAGRWSFQASFRRGKDIAVSFDSDAGQAVIPDGQGGEFEVAVADPNAPGFLSQGKLAYVPNKFYLKTLGDNRYWIKGGADSPEDFLAYEGFDNTRSGSQFVVKKYAGHVRDWTPGDPDWDDGRGKAIIGAINYLAEQHVNLIYFLPMNIGGDGQNVWPFAGKINPAGDPANDNTHYDISKLHQWEIVFDHAQKKGIVLHVVFNEAEKKNKLELGGKDLTTERKLYYREMLARFGHHNALIWNLCEEYNIGLNLGPENVKAFAAYIAQLNPYDHPITVHHAKDAVEAWKPFLGDDLFSITSLQIGSKDIEPVVETFRELTRQAGRPVPVAVDEFTVTTKGQAWIPVDDSATLRKEKLWPAYLSGGQVEFIVAELLDTQDFRKYEDLWKFIWYARKFMERRLPFWEMEPSDELLTGESVYAGKTCSHDGQVFAKAGEYYAIYLPTAQQTGELDLSDAPGRFVKRWYNPRTGTIEGARERLTGGQKVQIGPAPGAPDEDWVVLVKKRKSN